MSTLMTSSEACKEDLANIDDQLSRLPDPVPSSGPWTLGFRTRPLESATDPQTIEVFFDHPAPVDLIILMPAAHANDGHKLTVFGFPEHFYIERILADGSMDLIADYRKKPYPFHGLEPQRFPCPDRTPTTGIRITVTEAPHVLAPGKNFHVVALSEVFAFAGEQNIALNATVKVTNAKWALNTWGANYLADGFFLFIPSGERHRPKERDFHAYSDQVTVFFDLGRVQAIDELRIWPSVGADDFRHPRTGGAGFPSEIQLQVLEHPGDPKPRTLYRYKSKTLHLGTTPFMHHIPPVKGRYFKFILKNGIPDFRLAAPDLIILGEIELLSKGSVVTRGNQPAITVNTTHRGKTIIPKRLTNGWVGNGKIRPLRKWIEEFHLQRKLTRQRAVLQSALDEALEKEKEQARALTVSGSVLIVILALMIWVVRLLSERKWSRMKEQIACDLHDELGANVSSIAHSSEMAKELIEQGNKELLNKLMNRIIEAARLTADETRNFIQFLEGRDTGLELPGQIRSVAHKILGPIDTTCTFHDARPFLNLNPARKWDLLFFVKEALNNILKHADADHVEISTRKNGQQVQLIITDNGRGIPDDRLPPRHLKSRARRLKGELRIETGKNQGTRLQLTLHKRNIR